MKKNIVLKKATYPHEIVILDAESGRFSMQPAVDSIVQGNYAVVCGDEFGVFATGKNLYFQWNDKCWNFQDIGLMVKYQHDLQRGVTRFSIGDAVIEYPAWWVGDIDFDPNVPERDEDEDFLGYVAHLACDEDLQLVLINSWDKSN
ncbi:hypothetical protein VA599_20440 [Chromobacterium sp. TRC.1.1.SA]|uniref:Uncharacterized protein n=1 Tax=Chromobacterium indicum TaxID=3110228 RepID=A0ABV0CQC0_9NEIS